MTKRLSLTVIILALLTVAIAHAAPPTVTRWTLENGVRVVVLHFEGSEHCAIFSLLPLGLGADGPDCTQWSHLVEHLTLRTTGPIKDYRERNAETMPSGMHLDWMGSAAKWKEGLELQAKWLGGLPFQERILREEVPKALSEVDFTVPKGFTHKWAFAAWNQVVRHQRERVEVRGALEKATLADLVRYRDEHLAIPGRVMFCVAGGIPADTLRPAVTETIGRIQSQAKVLPAVPKPRKAPADLRTKWDLAAQHLLVTWPIPSPDKPDYAPLYLAAQALAMAVATDSELQSRRTPILASTETVTPESTFFVVSVPVPEKGDPVHLRKRIDHHLAMLRERALPTVPMLAQGLSVQMSAEALDLAAIRAQGGIPPQMTDAMLQGNMALQRAILEWRHKDLTAFATELKALTSERVADAVRLHLTDGQRTTLLLEPDGGSQSAIRDP